MCVVAVWELEKSRWPLVDHAKHRLSLVPLNLQTRGHAAKDLLVIIWRLEHLQYTLFEAMQHLILRVLREAFRCIRYPVIAQGGTSRCVGRDLHSVLDGILWTNFYGRICRIKRCRYVFREQRSGERCLLNACTFVVSAVSA